MNLREARTIISTETDEHRTFRLAQAAATICSRRNARHVPLEELVACLRRGNGLKETRLVSEYAAVALHDRTGREMPPGPHGGELIVDPEDWLTYLKQHKLV